MRLVTPYKESSSGKKEQVAKMFDSIAFRYDFLNQLLSLGIHHSWRKKAVKYFINDKPGLVLDIATGTGDFAIAALKAKPGKVIGVDISEGMLKFGIEKIKKRGLEDMIELKKGDAENLDFADNSVDVITVGFGVRNYENLEKGLQNMLRVLKPGGKLVVLEFSKPTGFFRHIYNFYFKYITPTVGKLFSKDSTAYTYLPESVQAFPDGKNFTAVLDKLGYKNSAFRPLTLGIATIYYAIK
ncbi:MAG: bifunctional demethylmenaquinone methyltransferase/2-methoxy-6-polyprenyl-1,4-benzoquinol methylase UbiE [Bacteroidia bacterium]